MGPRDPHAWEVEGPRLFLRVFEARTLLISKPGLQGESRIKQLDMRFTCTSAFYSVFVQI